MVMYLELRKFFLYRETMVIKQGLKVKKAFNVAYQGRLFPQFNIQWLSIIYSINSTHQYPVKIFIFNAYSTYSSMTSLPLHSSTSLSMHQLQPATRELFWH